MKANKPLTVEQAFLKVLYQRGLLTSIGYPKYIVRNMKVYHKDNRITINKMVEVITAAGYVCVQESKYALA